MNQAGIPSAGIRRCSLLVAICLILSASMAKAEPITEQQAHAIGVDAYLYFYPLITMDLTRKQLSNVEPGKGFGGPMNRFANVPAYPTAEDRAVVRPNFDTLYSSAWLDLTKEPVVVSVPDTGGRYYLLPILDMWTDVFASPGWRTTGTQAQTLVIVPRNSSCPRIPSASRRRRHTCGSSDVSRLMGRQITKRFTRSRQV
jgi:hypothetical protein